MDTSQPHDAAGNPVAPHRPPEVTELPMWADAPDLPDGFEARILDGNWYGTGPIIVIWNPSLQLHVDIPMSQATPDGIFLAVQVICNSVQPPPSIESLVRH